MNMKILFIDIDGVLVPDKCKYLNHKAPETMKDVDHWCYFDPFAVAFLNEVFAKEHTLHGVIHSTWKKFYTEDELKIMFSSSGCNFRWHNDMVAVTTSTKFDSRWDDIDNWLLQHIEVKRQDFAIIDDAKPASNLKSRTVRTNEQIGITDKNCERLLNLLQIKLL